MAKRALFALLLAAGSCSPAPQTLEELLAEPDALRRVAGFAEHLDRVPPDSLPEVLAALAGSALDGNDPEYVLFATWWARFDPRSALAWTRGEPRAFSYATLGAVFRSWAQRDPKGALRGAVGLPPDQEESAKQAVMAGWEESDPEGAVAWVGSLDATSLRQEAAEHLARRRVLSLGPEGAMRWIATLPPRGFGRELAQRVVGEVALLDPSAALAWAEERIAGSRRPTGIPRRIGTRWIHRDPAAAMQWLSSLPPGKDRDDGVMESFRDWRSANRVAANAWLSRQAHEPWLEPALALYADELAQDSPEEGLALVRGFEDRALSDRFFTGIARKWLQRDYEAADAWLQGVEMPEEMRKRVYAIGMSEEEALALREERKAARAAKASRARDARLRSSSPDSTADPRPDPAPPK